LLAKEKSPYVPLTNGILNTAPAEVFYRIPLTGAEPAFEQ
jgi:hypothetical protein